MRRHVSFAPLLAAAIAIVASPAGGAEFDDGMEAYESKDFAAARAVFLDLAALGNGAAQHNLGAMALRGEGAPQDRGEAAGWMLAARENGHDATPKALDSLRQQLTPSERETAERIVDRFGRAALEANVLPSPLVAHRQTEARDVDATIEHPRFVSGESPRYPEGPLRRGGRRGPPEPEQAIVVLRVVLGTDGRPRDPEVVVSIPPASDGGRPFIEALTRAVLTRRYEPARREGRPLAVVYTFKAEFRMPDQKGIVKRDFLENVRAAAASGDARAQFVAGIADFEAPQSVDGKGRSTENRRLILAAAQAGVPEAQLMIGRTLSRQAKSAKALPWLERASAAGLAGARVSYGLELLTQKDPPYERIRGLLERASEADDPFAVRHALAALACSTDALLRSPKAALRIAKRVSLDRDPDPLTAEAVAAAHAAVGDFDEARRAQRVAIARAKKIGWNVSAMEKRLEGYASSRACEDDFLPAAAAELLPRRQPR